jgi:hypothetical protein
MKHLSLIPRCLLIITCLSLAACGGIGTKTTQKTATGSHASSPQVFTRPSAPLGLYAGYYLGGGGISPANSALTGVDAQTQLHKPVNPLGSSDTFALLQEYGNVLQVNIPDLLNRSSDRPTTLTQYTDALTNITARAKQTAGDLTTQLQQLKTDDKNQASSVSGIQNRINTAFKAGDYATAGSLQQDLTNAQTTLTQTQSKEKQATDTLATYNTLITVAGKRLQAIAQNREILIAGLQVVNVPGIENLGILSGSSAGGGSFLGF